MSKKKTLPAKPARKTAVEAAKPPLATGDVTTGEMKSVLGYMLRRAQVAVFQQFMTESRHLDIRPTQIGVLSVIRENPGRKQAEISAALGIQRTNFVAIFDELERRRLAKRVRTENDRRAYALYLTEEGEAFVAGWSGEQKKLEEKLVALVGGPEEYQRLMGMLEKLASLQGAP